MPSTTYSLAKAVSLTDYLPAFRTKEKVQSWDWEKLVTRKTSSRSTEQVFSFTGLPAARRTNELQPIYYADIAELAATTYTAAKYTLATMFSWEIIKYNQHLPDLFREAGAAMGESHSFIRDVAAAATYNRAFNSSYTMYDGTELCGTHTMKDGGTLDNALTAASPSFDNLWLALNHFETSLVTHQGLYIRDTPKYIIAHPSYEKEWRAILETDGKPNTANNDKNTVRSYGLELVLCRHLTTSTYWFVAGSMWKESNLWFDIERPGKPDMEDDFDRMATKLRTMQAFMHGPKEFVYIVGNPGA